MSNRFYIWLLFSASLAAQVPTVPNSTFPIFRQNVNISLKWLDTHKAEAAATAAALASKEPIDITLLRGSQTYTDPAWLILSKSKVGLSLVDNTSDAAKPISTATAAALAGKEPVDATILRSGQAYTNPTWLTLSRTGGRLTGFGGAAALDVGAMAGTVAPGNAAITVNGQACALGGSCTVADATKAPLANPVFTGTLTVGSRVFDSRANLRNWDAAIAKRTVNGVGNPTILFVGDSWTNNGYITGPLRSSLQATYGNGGPGYFDLTEYYATNPAGVNVARGGSWNDIAVQTGGAYCIQATQGHSVDTSGPATKTITATATSFAIHYATLPGGGTFSYKIDGGAAYPVSTAPSGTNLIASAKSNLFSDAAWGVSGATIAATADTLDPFGGSAVWKLTEDTSTGYHRLYGGASTRTATGVYTDSIYAKAGTRTILSVTDDANPTIPAVDFDLSAGTIIYTPVFTGVSGSITAVGNGWYRLSYIFPDPTGGAHKPFFRIMSVPGTPSYTGTLASLYVAFAQTNPGAAAMPYIDASSTATTYTTLSISGLSNASHVVVLTITGAGTAGVNMCGGEANLDVAGVRLHKVGASGAAASVYAALNATIWQAAVASLHPDLVVLEFGVNELVVNVAPAAQAASLTTLISRIHTAVPLADILLLPPVDVGVTGTYVIEDYIAAQAALAVAQGIGFLAQDKQFQSYALSNGRGLFLNTAHLNPSGGQTYASGVLRWLNGF